jgi:hypothetical protein
MTPSALSETSPSESEMKPFPISEISQSESETTTPPAIPDILLAELENMITYELKEKETTLFEITTKTTPKLSEEPLSTLATNLLLVLSHTTPSESETITHSATSETLPSKSETTLPSLSEVSLFKLETIPMLESSQVNQSYNI